MHKNCPSRRANTSEVCVNVFGFGVLKVFICFVLVYLNIAFGI